MIRLQNVSKFYASGDNNVSLGLHNVSLEMKKGEIIGVVGESGSGKSTFLNVVSMLDTFEDGEIYYDDVPASSLTPEEIGEFRKQHIGFIFQNYNLIDSYTVLQNVLMPLQIKGITGREAKEKAKEIIKKVGLEHRMHHKGTKLSGGEKQRCVIARALASDSEILACDEPTGNLDSKTGREIIELIRDVAKDKLVIIVTHNYEELSDIITRRLTFADGNLIEDTNLKEADIVVDKLNEEVDYKFSFKEKSKLSLKDILSTPKKSILSFLIFFAVAFFVAYLYTGILTYKKSYSDPGIYENVAKDRYIVYGKNDKEIDLNDFANYDYNTFAFLEDEYFVINGTNGSDSCYLRYALPSQKLKKGRLPKEDNEVILGVPEQSIVTYYNDELRISSYSFNTAIYDIDKYNVLKDKRFKVVGYYVIDDATVNHFLISGTKEFNNLLKEFFSVGYAAQSGSVRLAGEDCLIELDDNIAKDKISITLPTNLEGKFYDVNSLIDVLFRSRTIDKTEYELEIEYTGLNTFKATACMETMLKLYKLAEKDSYISIYETDQLKIDNMVSDLQNKGYGVCNAKDAYFHEDVSMAAILNTVIYAFYLIGVVFALVVVFFISYFILARIYSIKNKDYTVFRTLGMSKKDMASLVRIQTVIQSGFASILVLVIVLISYIFKHPIISGFHRVGVLGIIIYLIFMFLYSLFFAIRFNRKLYKFSVQKTFRGGVLGND